MYTCVDAVNQNIFPRRLPVMYVYTLVPAMCRRGLPAYIHVSLEQAIFTQSDCDILFVSNFAECPTMARDVEDLIPKGLQLLDSTTIISNRTLTFQNLSAGVFQRDGGGELWFTSALRFFIMEDALRTSGYGEMMHVEADNMIYGKFSSLLPLLRTGYRGLAATPMTGKLFITASTFWVSELSALVEFNDFLLALASKNSTEWTDYLKWLRPLACCARGGRGIDNDSNGNGIKPFAINEMSMLAYYHVRNASQLNLFPIIPAHNSTLPKVDSKILHFSPGGDRVGPPTGRGIWDPGSWGQHLGGTASKRGALATACVFNL